MTISAVTALPGTLVPLSLRTNVCWTLAGNTVYAACQWGVLVVLARMGSEDAVGLCALALALTAPIIIASQLQLRSVQATDALRQFAFGHYLTLRIVMTTLALAVIAAAGAFSGYDARIVTVILGIGGAKAADAIGDVFLGRWQQDERMDAVAITFIASGLLTLGATALSMALTGSVAVVALAWAACSCVNLAWVVERSRRVYHLRWADAVVQDRAELVRLARLALPLGIVMMLVSVNANIPRYLVEHYLGLSKLGVFATIAYLGVAGGAVFNAVGQAVSPRLSRAYAAGGGAPADVLLVRLFVLALLLGTGGIVVAFAAGPVLLAEIYGDAYAHAAPLLAAIMIATTLSYFASALGYALTAAREFALQAPLFVAVTAVTAGAGIVLIPQLGMVGAAWAMGVGSAFQVTASAVLLRRAVGAPR